MEKKHIIATILLFLTNMLIPIILGIQIGKLIFSVFEKIDILFTIFILTFGVINYIMIQFAIIMQYDDFKKQGEYR